VKIVIRRGRPRLLALLVLTMLWGAAAPTPAAEARTAPPPHGQTTGHAAPWTPPPEPPAGSAALPNGLRKEVFGFLPYWALDATDLQWMRYDLVSTIAYFGVGARSDGTLATNTTSWNGWLSSAMTGVINAAHARGVKVVVSITMMAYDGGAQQATLLGNDAARARLINAIVATVRDRHADGVNLDFEPVYAAQRSQYTSFVRQLKAALVAAGVGAYLTVCTTAGAATWSTGYDVSALVAPGAADQIFVMGYDYSWSGSARAGGVAPMSSPYILDVTDSVTDFLELIPGSKIIWGAPYYGRTWRTTTSELNSPTVAGAASSSVAYWYTANLTRSQQYGRLWDSVGKVPWYRYYDTSVGSWVQGYYEDAASLAFKWDMVNQLGLAGAGIWHLLMDGGRSELWNLLANRFQADTSPPTGGVSVLPPTVDSLGVQVRWRAIDVGSSIASYTVQVRDRATSTWSTWLANTTATSATWVGAAGHAYEFRLSAIDSRGNRQGWVAAAPDPGPSLTVGGFARVVTDSLNVRSAAGTGYAVLDVLALGDRVAILSGPVASGGYSWYEVQFDFTEWPSADYPRVGWVAAGSGTTPYLEPAVAPTVTRLQPVITGYGSSPRRFSPNGDGVADTTTATFTLPSSASTATLDVINSTGSIVRSLALGPLGPGPQAVAWDGRLGGAEGAVAPADAYLMRVTASLADGTHVAPMPIANAATLAAWGVVLDLSGPTVQTRQPDPSTTNLATVVTAQLSEAVTGVSQTSLTVSDALTGAVVPGSVTLDGSASIVTFVPSEPLRVGRLYEAAIGSGLVDQVGNSMTEVLWTFATAPAVGRAVRLAGSDRYATAAMISAATYLPGVPEVFVASGATYADSLAAGAAAAARGAPLLLTAATSLPAATAAELARLKPARVYIVGGTAVISDGVADAIGGYTRPTPAVMTRLSGADRYATAAAVSAAFHGPSAPVVLVATGENFPDGLSAGPAAGVVDAPLLLVRRETVPSATAAELTRLAPQRVVVVGSTGVISDAVVAALAGWATTGVERLAGTDRYATSAAIAARFFPAAVVATYVATGENFPDALAAGPAAASWGGPLVLVRFSSVPAPSGVELARLDPQAIFVAGGEGVVSPAVQQAVSGYAGP
jgi:spore germination protein YaaH/putative cell wall-binding protein